MERSSQALRSCKISRQTLCTLLLVPSCSNIFSFQSLTRMAQEYASNKPKGFKNHIENVAIVGVRLSTAGRFLRDVCFQILVLC